MIPADAHRARLALRYLGPNVGHLHLFPNAASIAASVGQQDARRGKVIGHDRIEPWGEEGKYRLIFAGKAEPIGPVPLGDAPPGAMQGPRYTTLARLRSAESLAEILGRP